MAAASAASFLPRLPVGGDELGGDEPDGVSEALELARPVMGTAAGFESDGARRQGGDEFEELGARDLWLEQDRLAGFVDAVEGKNVLGEVDAEGYDGHGTSPFRVRDENRNPIVVPVADGR